MERRRVAALAAALALSGTLLFPSAAAPLVSGPSDDVGAGVELVPLDGPDSEYASLEDGELVVDLSAGEAAGLNPDAVTTFDDVFAVQYAGSASARVWLTHDSDAVTFYARGEPVASAADGVALAADESVAVGVRVDTTALSGDDDGLAGEFTVHSRVAEPEREGALSLDADVGSNVRRAASGDGGWRFTVLHAAAGEPVSLNTSLEVASNDGGSVTLDELLVTRSSGGSLSVDVAAVESPDAGELPAGESADALGAFEVDVGAGADSVRNGTFRFGVAPGFLEAAGASAGELTLYRNSGGEWSELDVEVGGERDGRVLVTAETPGFSSFVLAAERPAIGVTSASVEPASMAANGSATVTAAVENAGGAAGERAVAVAMNGSVAGERAVALGSGESATVSFEVSPSPGEYAVSVGNATAGTLVVEAASDDAPAEEDQPANRVAPDADTGSGDGPLATLSGIDLSAVVGMLTLLVIVVATLALARRVARE